MGSRIGLNSTMTRSAYVSPLLYVGAPPDDPAPWVRGVREVQSAHEAAALIQVGVLAVVPNSNVARQALLMLGAEGKAAMYATGGYHHRWEEPLQ